jgi:hypothetical protein
MAAAVADKARQMLADASRFLFFDADGKVLAASWEVRHRMCVWGRSALRICAVWNGLLGNATDR